PPRRPGAPPGTRRGECRRSSWPPLSAGRSAPAAAWNGSPSRAFSPLAGKDLPAFQLPHDGAVHLFGRGRGVDQHHPLRAPPLDFQVALPDPLVVGAIPRLQPVGGAAAPPDRFL